MSAKPLAEKAYKINEAAELYGVSPSTIRAAIKATDGNVLRAKNISSNAEHPRYRIASSDLAAWWAGLADAS